MYFFIKTAIERAGTTQTDKIIAAVEKEPRPGKHRKDGKFCYPRITRS